MSGRGVYRSFFEISPIYLTGSSPLVSSISGGTLPMVALLPASLTAVVEGMDNFFAYFIPLPGATLVDNQVSTYPFANQSVAGNALITQPLQIGMKMIVPVRETSGYWTKFAQMMALKYALDQHNGYGGLYTVVTPTYVYTNCIMTRMHDISGGESAQAQHTWQLDFVQPLLTIEQATAAQNALTSKISSGAQITSADTSGVSLNTGISSPGVTGSLTGSTAVGGSVATGAGISSTVPNL